MGLRSGAVHDLDRITARVFGTGSRNSGCRLDAYRDGDTYFVDIDLPGVEPASIEVAADREVLTIRAERKQGGPESGAALPADTVTRQVELAEALDTDSLDARYDEGVLTLRIPVDEVGDLPAAA
jgi:HSP20 family protein